MAAEGEEVCSSICRIEMRELSFRGRTVRRMGVDERTGERNWMCEVRTCGWGLEGLVRRLYDLAVEWIRASR